MPEQIYEPRVYSVSDFVSWRTKDELELSPKFQRRPVWQRKAKSFLIDTVVRGFPMPHIYMRERIDPVKMKTVREVVDGQQRIRTLLSFLDGDQTVLPSHNSDIAGKKFDQLTEEQRVRVLRYPIPVAILFQASDADVIEIFSRLNANTLPLNSQEKLNAKFFGSFKQAVYRLGAEHLEYWRNNKILTEQRIARMGEAEFTGELVIAMMDGLQDGKKKMESFYSLYDDEFPEEETIRRQFKSTLVAIDKMMGQDVRDSRLRGRALFYTLFTCIYHVLYGLVDTQEPRPRLKKSAYGAARERILELVNLLGEDSVEAEFQEWVDASTSSTDNLPQRKTRLKYFIKAILNAHGM